MTADELRLSPAQTLRVLASTEQELQVESTWLPNQPPQTHWHPYQRETFDVLEGELTVEVGGGPARLLTAGEQLAIPARTAHRMWNAGSVPARARWTITPPGRTLAMFTHIDGGRSFLRDLTLLLRFRRELRLGSPPG